MWTVEHSFPFHSGAAFIGDFWVWDALSSVFGKAERKGRVSLCTMGNFSWDHLSHCCPGWIGHSKRASEAPVGVLLILLELNSISHFSLYFNDGCRFCLPKVVR